MAPRSWRTSLVRRTVVLVAAFALSGCLTQATRDAMNTQGEALIGEVASAIGRIRDFVTPQAEEDVGGGSKRSAPVASTESGIATDMAEAESPLDAADKSGQNALASETLVESTEDESPTLVSTVDDTEAEDDSSEDPVGSESSRSLPLPRTLTIRRADRGASTLPGGNPVRLVLNLSSSTDRSVPDSILVTATEMSRQAPYFSKRLSPKSGSARLSVDVTPPPGLESDTRVKVFARLKTDGVSTLEANTELVFRSGEHDLYVQFTRAAGNGDRERVALDYVTQYPNGRYLKEVGGFLGRIWWVTAQSDCESPELKKYVRYLSGLELEHSAEARDRDRIRKDYERASAEDTYKAARVFVKANQDNPCGHLLGERMQIAYWQSRSSESVHVHTQMGDLLYDQGDHRRAIKHYEFAADRNHVPAILSLAGLYYYDLNQKQKAKSVIDRAIESTGAKDARIQYWRGILEKSQNVSLAKDRFTSAIALNQRCANCFFERGLLRELSRDHDGAAEDFKRVIDLNKQGVSVSPSKLNQAASYLAKLLAQK